MNKPFVPHITEKSYTGIAESKTAASTYTFRVPRGVTKEVIKNQVEKTYNVHVTDVRIINLPGKARRFKGILGRTQALKKAIVRLKPGEQIADFTPEAAADTDSSK